MFWRKKKEQPPNYRSYNIELEIHLAGATKAYTYTCEGATDKESLDTLNALFQNVQDAIDQDKKTVALFYTVVKVSAILFFRKNITLRR